MSAARRALALAAALATSAPAAVRGAEPVLTIVAPAAMRPGDVVRVELVALNPGFGEQLQLEAQPTLSAAIRTPTASFPVTLSATSDAPVEVHPRGFGARSYTMTVPDVPDGEAVLTVAVGETEVAAATRIARDGAPRAGEPLATSIAADAFPRTSPGRISIYQPNYFIYGAGGEPAVKFQLSFKYRILTFGRDTPERPRPRLQFAYTQRSLWDVKAASAPFHDTSYMPELFLESLEPLRSGSHPLSFLGWAGGYKHESNGKNGEDSRGVNALFVRAYFEAGRTEGWYLVLSPEVLHHVGSIDHMPDFEKYRGYGKLIVAVGHGAGASLVWTAIPEHSFEHVTNQLDLSIPIGIRALDFAAFFLVQYFNGYAESLLDYTHRSQSVRAGISIVR